MSNSLETQKKYYWSNGWVRVPGVFTLEQVERVKALASKISEYEMTQLRTANGIVDVAANGSFLPRKLDYPFQKHAVFREFVLHDKLESTISSILGQQAYLIRDHIFMKPPCCGSAKPFHQDNAHLLCDPADDVIAAWIALDNADLNNGCLKYVRGSHKWKLQEHKEVEGARHNVKPIGNLDFQADAIDLGEADPGDVLLHHSLTFHGSNENKSDKWRRGYATHWVGKNVHCSSDALEWSYSKTIGGRKLRHLSK